MPQTKSFDFHIFWDEKKVVATADYYSREQFIARCIREVEEDNDLIKIDIKEDTYEMDTCAFRMLGNGNAGYVLGAGGRGVFKVHTVEFENKSSSNTSSSTKPESDPGLFKKFMNKVKSLLGVE